MAQSKTQNSRKRTASKTASARTSGSGSRKKSAAARREEPKERGGTGREILLCLALAFSVLLLLANFGLAGNIGNRMSDALFGTFGLMEYVLPFAIFFGFAFFIANVRNSLIVRKLIGFVLMFVFMAAFLHLLTMGYTRNADMSEVYRLSMEERNGGGVVGGAVSSFFGAAFGMIGAYVLTVFGLVAAAIIMTQKPLLSVLGERSREAARKAKEKRNIRQTERQEEKKEKEALEKLKRTEKQLERDQRIRMIEQETAKKEIQRVRESGASLSLRDAVLTEDVSPLMAVTLERHKPQNITDVKREEEKKKKISGKTQEVKKTEKAGEREKTPEQTFTINDMPSFTIDGLSPGGNQDAPYGMPSFLKSVTGEAADISEKKEEEAVPEKAEEKPAGDTAPKPEKAPAKPAGKRKSGSADKALPDADAIRDEIAGNAVAGPKYSLPSAELLTRGKAAKVDSEKSLMMTAGKLQQTLKDFGVNVNVVNVSRGPTVTRYELQPEHGVKVSRIISLQDDIKLNLATSEIRIEAPIPGKAAVGIEVPNKEIAPVMLRELVESPEFQGSRANLAFAVGKDIGGRPVIADIEKMPHLLIAGATGSGKSVCINTLIMSILFKSTPDQVKMLMIDPKVVELKIYDGIPHLLIPVVTDAKKAAGALNWAVQEMTERYNKFASYPGVRDIRSYNTRIRKMNAGLEAADRLPEMPRLVVIVDELADLMMVASGEVEDAICRLAQLARAAGIHLIIATQRPSVNVVTGLIKANMPSRIALAVTSGIDSRTILDMNGAEKLLGKGDMLFYPQGYPKPARVQGAYVSDEDITRVVDFLVSQTVKNEYNEDIEDRISVMSRDAVVSAQAQDDGQDEYFADSGRLIIEKDKASIGMLQRAFKIGFNRAARIMDQLSEAGVVGGEEGTKPRKILMTMAEFENYLAEKGSEGT